MLDIHLNIDKVEPYNKIKIEEEIINTKVKPKVILQWNKEDGIIILDEVTKMKGIPKKAQEYKISGKDTFIDYILNYYKQSSYKSTIVGKKKLDVVEDFNSYDFMKFKPQIIKIIQKAISVNLKTIDILESI